MNTEPIIKKSKLFGFRSNKVWKKAVSIIYLVLCALYLVSLFEGRYEKITVYDFLIDKLYSVVSLFLMLSPYIFLSNTKFRDKLPLFKKHKAGASIGGMAIILLALIILSGVVNGFHSQEYLADMENHAYIVTLLEAATCEKDGKNEYHCEYCGKDTVEKIKASGHTWDSGKVTVEATCTTTGVLTYTCSACNGSKTEEIAAKGHTMKQVSADAEKIVHKCDVCGLESIETAKKDPEPEEPKKTTPTTETPAGNNPEDDTKTESNPMEAQFKALGFTSDEAAKMEEIFATVGIAEINTIQAGIGSGIDNLQSFTCNIYDSSADKGGLSVLFTIEKRQLCFIALNGIPTTKVDYAYINIFGNVKFKTSNGKKSVTLYDIWDENGEIIPGAIGYKAVLDWGNKKITEYK